MVTKSSKSYVTPRVINFVNVGKVWSTYLESNFAGCPVLYKPEYPYSAKKRHSVVFYIDQPDVVGVRGPYGERSIAPIEWYDKYGVRELIAKAEKGIYPNLEDDLKKRPVGKSSKSSWVIAAEQLAARDRPLKKRSITSKGSRKKRVSLRETADSGIKRTPLKGRKRKVT